VTVILAVRIAGRLGGMQGEMEEADIGHGFAVSRSAKLAVRFGRANRTCLRHAPNVASAVTISSRPDEQYGINECTGRFFTKSTDAMEVDSYPHVRVDNLDCITRLIRHHVQDGPLDSVYMP